MTASVFDNDQASILEEGVNDFLPKPFKQERLLGILQKHLNIMYRYKGVAQGRLRASEAELKRDETHQKSVATAITVANTLTPESTQSIISTKVLIVDDNPVNRKIANKILSNAGCLCEEASNGKEALAVIETTHPDIMLLDMNMPIMDGYEVLERLKEMGIDGRMPVIASTAENDVEIESELIALGATAICSKPLNAEKLKSTIHHLVH